MDGILDTCHTLSRAETSFFLLPRWTSRVRISSPALQIPRSCARDDGSNEARKITGDHCASLAKWCESGVKPEGGRRGGETPTPLCGKTPRWAAEARRHPFGRKTARA